MKNFLINYYVICDLTAQDKTALVGDRHPRHYLFELVGHQLGDDFVANIA